MTMNKLTIQILIYFDIQSMNAFLALVCDVFLCFVTFPYGVLGWVWHLIVSIPDSSTSELRVRLAP